MCDQTEVSYLPNDIVWVKLGSVWWPGQVQDKEKVPEHVTSGLRKTPLAVVKFFDEDYYEFVKNLDQIYHYNCLKKFEFIKKGLDMCRASSNREVPSNMKRFPVDVSLAETMTGGDPNIVDDPRFLPEKKFDYSELFGSTKKPKGKKTRQSQGRTPGTSGNGNGNVGECETPRTITHPRLIRKALTGKSDYESKIRLQVTPPRDEDGKVYTCQSCGYVTSRINVLILHNKGHIGGFNPNAQVQLPSTQPRGVRSAPARISPKKRPAPMSEETPKRRPVKKRAKKEERASTLKKKNEAIRDSLLKDWDEDSEEEVLEPAKPPVEEPKPAEKSCFDFEDNDDSIAPNESLKFGQKLPRVIEEKPKKRSEEEEEFESLLEETQVPVIPDLPLAPVKESTSPPPPEPEPEEGIVEEKEEEDNKKNEKDEKKEEKLEEKLEKKDEKQQEKDEEKQEVDEEKGEKNKIEDVTKLEPEKEQEEKIDKVLKATKDPEEAAKKVEEKESEQPNEQEKNKMEVEVQEEKKEETEGEKNLELEEEQSKMELEDEENKMEVEENGEETDEKVVENGKDVKEVHETQLDEPASKEAEDKKEVLDVQQMEFDINSMPIVIEEDLIAQVEPKQAPAAEPTVGQNVAKIRIQLRKAGEMDEKTRNGQQVITIPGKPKTPQRPAPAPRRNLGKLKAGNIIASKGPGGTSQVMILKPQNPNAGTKFSVGKNQKVSQVQVINAPQQSPVGNKLYLFNPTTSGGNKILTLGQQRPVTGKLVPGTRLITTSQKNPGVIPIMKNVIVSKQSSVLNSKPVQSIVVNKQGSQSVIFAPGQSSQKIQLVAANAGKKIVVSRPQVKAQQNSTVFVQPKTTTTQKRQARLVSPNILQRPQRKNQRGGKQQALKIPSTTIQSDIITVPMLAQSLPTTQPEPIKMMYLALDEHGNYQQVENPFESNSAETLYIDTGSAVTAEPESGNIFLSIDEAGNLVNISSANTTAPSQDILAKALADTQVLQSEYLEPQYPAPTLSHNVLETSLTLNQPIMTPLEVPSSVAPQISTNLLKKPSEPSMPLLTEDLEVPSQNVFQNSQLTFQLTLDETPASTSGVSQLLSLPAEPIETETVVEHGTEVIYNPDDKPDDQRR